MTSEKGSELDGILEAFEAARRRSRGREALKHISAGTIPSRRPADLDVQAPVRFTTQAVRKFDPKLLRVLPSECHSDGPEGIDTDLLARLFGFATGLQILEAVREALTYVPLSDEELSKTPLGRRMLEGNRRLRPRRGE